MGKKAGTMQAKRAEGRARKQPFSFAEVQKMAKSLEDAAGEVSAIANRMKMYDMDSIEVDGALKFERGLNLIHEWVALANVGVVIGRTQNH